MIHNILHRHLPSEFFKKMGDTQRLWSSSLKLYNEQTSANLGGGYSRAIKDWYISNNSEIYHDVKMLIENPDKIQKLFLYCNMQLPDIMATNCYKLLLNALQVYMCTHYAYDIYTFTKSSDFLNGFDWISLDDLSVVQSADNFKLNDTSITIHNETPMNMTFCEIEDIFNMYVGHCVYLRALKKDVAPFHTQWLEAFKKQKPDIYEQYLIFNITEHPSAWIDDVYTFLHKSVTCEEVPLMLNPE